MSAPKANGKVDFATFFALWAEEQRWDVPDIHWRAVHWLEHRGRLAVMRCFRGFAKSTILAVYNAWRYYIDPSYRILHQGDQDKTAHKTSRDTKSVLMRHPLTRNVGALEARGEATFWWVSGNADERNPSMQAAGILSTITSSRCEEAQNDDVEVPKNITNPENREKMRYRLGEQVHCMVPGARQLYVGTPHTHDSLYDEIEALGADCLTIKMFEREHRIDSASEPSYSLPFVPEFVLTGIGKGSRALIEGKDYTLRGTTATLANPNGALVDFYAGCAWPERFTLEEMEDRRRRTRTINEWDSQYQLHSKPVHEIRLDPGRLQPYSGEPVLSIVNRVAVLHIGKVRMVGVACKWDPSSGKLKSDKSSVAIVYQDEQGRRYWHRALRLTGEIAEFEKDGKTIKGGQVFQLVDHVLKFNIPRVVIETNGAGTFAPQMLRAALIQRGVKCAVVAHHEGTNKNKRILDAIEPPLLSQYLWAHDEVLFDEDGEASETVKQMREWIPSVTEQGDDDLDALAGAITQAPDRIQAVANGGKIFPGTPRTVWAPQGAVHDITLEVDS
jgi:hypothetical protein